MGPNVSELSLSNVSGLARSPYSVTDTTLLHLPGGVWADRVLATKLACDPGKACGEIAFGFPFVRSRIVLSLGVPEDNEDQTARNSCVAHCRYTGLHR
jgi:hypothetical protein